MLKTWLILFCLMTGIYSTGCSQSTQPEQEESIAQQMEAYMDENSKNIEDNFDRYETLRKLIMDNGEFLSFVRQEDGTCKVSSAAVVKTQLLISDSTVEKIRRLMEELKLCDAVYMQDDSLGSEPSLIIAPEDYSDIFIFYTPVLNENTDGERDSMNFRALKGGWYVEKFLQV